MWTFYIFVSIFLTRTFASGSNDINWNWNSTDLPETQFSEQILKWTNSAMRFLLDFHLCIESNLGSEDECFKLSSTLTSKVAVYLGYDKKRIVRHGVTNLRGHGYKSGEEIRSFALGKSNTNEVLPTQPDGLSPSQIQSLLQGRRKVFAVLPDSSSVKSSGAHDVILALDPYPYANFGHLIGLFYVDFNVEARLCQEEHQILISEQTCITVARKPRCPNILEKLTIGYHPRRCHIDFLPTVHLVGSSSSESHASQFATNLLDCIPIPGFANCPKLRPAEDTLQVLCDATHTNNKRFKKKLNFSNAQRCDTSFAGIGTRCKLFQTCDRAVLIGGGWNRFHSNKQTLENIHSVEDMLLRIGFASENIKMFYANGKNPKIQGGKPRYFSSGMKTGMRGHIRTICETRHCAETLFIYLNNPTTIEGDFLLWDMDRNGIADDLEIYTAKEFLSDISRCEAKRITVIADQSNSNILQSMLKQSNEHQNVLLFTPGSINQLITNGEITNIFVNSTQPSSCLSNFQQEATLRMKDSNPVVYDSSGGTISQLSLIGAPCDLNPPLQERELKSLYQGCQNVPTSIWFSLNYSEFHDDDDDEIDDKDSSENSPNNRRNQK